MMIGGILLLFLFDGVDMISAFARQNPETDIMSSLNRLEEYELLKEKSDSVSSVGDSLCFFMHGIEIGTCAILVCRRKSVHKNRTYRSDASVQQR